MDFWHSINGMAQVEITGADTAGALSALNHAGIRIFETVSVDELTLLFQIRRQDLKKAGRITGRRGDSIRVVGKKGLYWTLRGLLHRPLLTLGVLCLLSLGMFLPTRIFFFRVEGNVTVPARLILESAARCGIAFGAERSEVRSEKMKNALLEALPQLQWAGINTSGCVATISVRERAEQEQLPPEHSVSSIVAVRDGVILSSTVTRGNGICRPGQAVKAGEVLISGYTDCGISIRAEQAQGEVFASTERKLTVCTPDSCMKKVSVTRQEKKYSLIFGKKRINFYKGSGILDTTCDKMYEESYVTLPGGFQLPVALVTEVWTYHDCETVQLTREQSLEQMSEFASVYLKRHMIAGQILSARESEAERDGSYCLEGVYACQEMIGRVQKEEIMQPNGTHD